MAAHIADLPDPPNRGDDQLTFTTKADALLGALPAFVTQANALSDDVEANADSAATDASTATAQALIATAAATSAASSANATAWVSGTTYALNVVTISQINFQTYRKITASSVSTIDPANDPTNWVNASANLVPRFSFTGTSTITQTHFNGLIYCSGTFTVAFDSAANLKNGFSCFIANEGTGDITLDPSGAQTIDGLTSYIMYPGEARFVQCNGTDLKTVVIKPYRKRFTTSGTWTKPPGYSQHGGIIWNAGNSGAKSAASSLANGGAGGGAFPFLLADSILASTETVVIGAGGAAVTAANTAGNPGGSSSFGTHLVGVANAGGGGNERVGNGFFLGDNSTGVGVGFEGANSSTNYGWGGAASPASASGNGGNAIYGGAAGGAVSSSNVARNGGTSKHGGNGGNGSIAGNGTNGAQPAGGGGATQTGAQSGAGGAGQLDIWGIV